MTPRQFSQAILTWYDLQGRKALPWRQNITAYRVWVSEIMLQQTQVKTVLPFFQRFMQRFPTLTDLATASEDEVLHLWTGLGYYARGRNLRRTAQMIMQDFHAQFPSDIENLQLLPGIGRSTAGAIAAIAYNQPAAILDGNVKRILTRFHAIEGVTSNATVLAQLWKLAEQYTPKQRTADYTQAIMDLGAMLCTRTKPRCQECPVQKHCQAAIQGITQLFPTPKVRKSIPTKNVKMLIFSDRKNNAILLQKRPAVGVWGGLWSFPECDVDKDVSMWCVDKYRCQVSKVEELPGFKHTFTHFHLNIIPVYIEYKNWPQRVLDSNEYVWYKLASNLPLGFPAPVKQLLTQLISLKES